MLFALIFPLLTSTHAGPSPAAVQEPQLTLTIRAGGAEFRTGDEIPITFEIANAGTAAYSYHDRNYDRSGRMPEYRLEAYDDHGNLIPDPRTLSRVPRGYIGGGLSGLAELQPGQRFTKAIALNLWAFITAPGVYTVRGFYQSLGERDQVESAPIKLRVLPRSDREMGAYVQELTSKLRSAEGEAHKALVQRLMYTADRRAVWPLLNAAYKDSNSAFWVSEAISYYLPKDAEVMRKVLNAARYQGLSPSSVRALEDLQAPRDTIVELIGESLVHVDPDAQSEAALAAQNYPDDRFMERLIQLATDGKTIETRQRAIFAVARNRTDAGVAMLRRLLQDLDSTIRTTTRHAIEGAYLSSNVGRGRPLRTDDFPELVKR